MAELVRDDEGDLILGEMLDKVIRNDDPVRLQEPRNESIRLLRLTAGIVPQDMCVADAEASRHGPQPSFERSANGLVRVEERRDARGHDKIREYEERGKQRRRGERPATRYEAY